MSDANDTAGRSDALAPFGATGDLAQRGLSLPRRDGGARRADGSGDRHRPAATSLVFVWKRVRRHHADAATYELRERESVRSFASALRADAALRLTGQRRRVPPGRRVTSREGPPLLAATSTSVRPRVPRLADSRTLAFTVKATRAAASASPRSRSRARGRWRYRSQRNAVTTRA
jgi:hypothetical protein